jgi:MraZ protein
MDAEQQEQVPVFRYGAYDTTIDDKKRLVVPSAARNSLIPERDGKGFFVNIGVNRRLWFYPEATYTRLVSHTQQKKMDITPSTAALEFYQLLFANSYHREPDRQGRLVLPEKLLERAGMADVPMEVTFVGVMDHFECWPREAWAAQSDDLDKRMPQIVETARLIGLT